MWPGSSDQAHPALEAERGDVLARKLQAARPVEHRKPVGDKLVAAVAPAQGLGRRAPVADADRPLYLLGNERSWVKTTIVTPSLRFTARIVSNS